jgi:hypothetical protein
MLKFAATLFTIFCLLMATLHSPVLAQSRSRLKPDESKTADAKKRPDFRRIFDEETRKYESSSAEFDPLKYDNVIRKRQAKKGLSTKNKIGLALFIAGMAVLVVLLIKYGKNCIRSSPPDCTPGVDEFCTCEEYEQRK